jgi:hypothetical protein
VRDVLEEVLRGEADAVSVGVDGHTLPAGARGRLKQFALEQDFFLSHSFVPSLIFRTGFFDSTILRKGYDNIDTMFPHFPFLISLVERDCSIIVSKEKVITKGNNVGYSTFRFLTGWAASCRKIPDRQLRRKAASEVFGGAIFIKNMIYCCLTERAFRPASCWTEYRDLLFAALGLSSGTALKALLFLPLVLGPGLLHRIAWSRYKRHRARIGLPLPNFDEKR